MTGKTPALAVNTGSDISDRQKTSFLTVCRLIFGYSEYQPLLLHPDFVLFDKAFFMEYNWTTPRQRSGCFRRIFKRRDNPNKGDMR